MTGSRYRLAGSMGSDAAARISADEMSALPALAGDALRAVTRLPGIAGVGISARPHVRGGLQDEVLFSVDGIELLDPFHLGDFQGLVSAVDDRAVASMDVYTGGFPARYGKRMSGVMDLSTALAPDEFDTELGLSLYELSALTRGQELAGRPGDWLLSVRAGDLSRVVREINCLLYTSPSPRD